MKTRDDLELFIPKGAHKAASLVHDPSLSRSAARWSALIFVIFVGILFLPWTQNIHSTGKLTTYRPQDRPQELQSIIGGRIEQWYVSEGQFVHKGDTIVRLSEVKEKYLDTNILDRVKEQITAKQGSKTSTRDKVTALSDQIRALQEGQILSIRKAENKVKQAAFKVSIDSSEAVASMTDYEIAIAQLSRADSLFQKGLISLTDYERRRLKVQEANAKRVAAENKLLSSRNEVINANIEISSLEAEYIDKISKAQSELNGALSYLYETEGEISKMNVDMRNLAIRQGLYFVTAPQDGFIVKAQKEGIGENVKEGEVIVTIMPAAPELAVELFVDPLDVPLLARDRKVRLQFEGWPALVFSGWPEGSSGTFGGVISVIDQVDTQGKYRILVVPDRDDDPWPAQLRVGSGAYGWVLLQDVPIWYEIWRQLNGFPPDYMNPGPANTASEKPVSK